MTHHCLIEHGDQEWNKIKWCQKLRLLSPDNPQRLNYFRSDMSVRKEQARQLKNYKYTIHPFSKFRTWYEMYLVLLYASLLFTKPIDAGFMTKYFARGMPFYIRYTTCTDILSWIDIFINFFTGFDLNTNKIELDRRSIAKHYLFGPYFICDVISSIPRNLLYLITYYKSDYVGFIGMSGLIKIVRVVTCLNCIKRTAEYFHITSKGIFTLICSILISLLVVHWMTCLHFAIPKLIRRTFRLHNDDRSWFIKDELYFKPMFIQYIHSFFKSSACILGMRLSFYTTSLPEEYMLDIITYFTGKILIAFTWIILAIAILNWRSMDIEFAEIINQLEQYIKQKQMPLNLHNRIIQYFNFKYQGRYFKETLVRNLLSVNINDGIKLHACKSFIGNVSLFNELTLMEINKIVDCLTPEIYLPNDVIIQSGTLGDAMYFLSSGTVAVYSRSGMEICHLHDGAYFGEISIVLISHTRIVSVVAIETSHVYRLTRRDFQTCLLNKKNVMEKILQNAETRLEELNRAEETYKKLLFEQTYQKIS